MRYFFVAIVSLLVFQLPLKSDQPPEIRVLALVIASDHYNGKPVPIYRELEKVWRTYMHLDPKHVEAYFIKADPDLSSNYKIRGDVIWSKTADNLMPGILNKTLLSLECLSSRLDEFDFVLRTNLSSFFLFPQLLEVLKEAPKTQYYFGSDTGQPHSAGLIGSGCGFILSADLASDLVRNKDQLFNKIGWDDVLMGEHIIGKGINLVSAKREDFHKLTDWKSYKKEIDPTVFHYRVRTTQDSLRSDLSCHAEELYVHYDMLNTFYQKGELLQENQKNLLTTIARTVKVTPFELIKQFSKKPVFELKAGQKLIIHDIDTNDFLSALSAKNIQEKLKTLQKIIGKNSLDFLIEGSGFSEKFNLNEQSWTWFVGESGFLKITSSPTAVEKSASEIIACLENLPPQTAVPLKTYQDLLVTGLPPDVIEDFRLAQSSEKKSENSEGLFDSFRFKNHQIRVYALGAKKLKHSIDDNTGSILFQALSEGSQLQPRLMLVFAD